MPCSRCEEKTLSDIIEIPNSIDVVGKSIVEIKGVAESIVDRRCNCFYFTGCGSSYYSAMLMSFPLQVEGIEVYAIPSSEIIMYYSSRLSRNCCLISVSRSGETSETLEAMRIGKEKGTYNVIITINEKGASREYANKYLYIDVGVERGIVMTKSFYSMTLTGLVLTSSIIDIILGNKYNMVLHLDRLKEHAIKMIKEKENIFNLGSIYVKKNINRFVFLGSGPSYPIALEGSLKLKESSYIATEAMYALEFRHGPIATVGENQLIIVINQEGRSYSYVYRLYNELRAMNSYILRLSNRDVDENTILLSKTGFEELDALSAILPLQLMAYSYATALGLDIDSPRNLVRVVKHY
jgi:glucosamine--fructose-6-phosphate aminotransferase (isomerizing)